MQYETGIVYSLKELGERFISFARTSNNTTQAWELVDDRISTFYGATLKVPLNESDTSVASSTFYFVGDASLVRYSGTSDIDLPTYIQNKYPSDTIIIETNKNSLVDVYNYLTNLPQQNNAVFIFNGAENDLVNGNSIKDVIQLIEMIFDRSKTLGITPIFCVTPNSAIYSSASNIDKYLGFVNSGYIGEKKTIVCVGDDLTANSLTTGSWITYAQGKMKDMYFINQGSVGNTVQSAYSTFNSDVIDLCPDACFLFIGANDLLSSTKATLSAVVDNLKNMVTLCKNNDIVPVIGIYRPTLKYVSDFLATSSSTLSAVELHELFNLYMDACLDIAFNNGIKTIDIYYPLRGGYGNIPDNYLKSDKFRFSIDGEQLVGEYVASELEGIFFESGFYSKPKSARIFNFYDIFCKALSVDELSSTDVASLVSSNGKSYNSVGLSYIINFLDDAEISFDFHSANIGFYVSFQYNNITNNTYANWLKSKDRYMAESGDKLYEAREINGKYSSMNPFKNTGQILAVGLHTIFDKGLWMCEQGGITCAEEALHQKCKDNLMKVRETDFRDKKDKYGNIIYSYPFGEHLEDIFLPFPSRGCPWFTISNKDINTYNVKKYGLKFWFVKNNYDAVIVFSTSEEAGEPVYQSMSFGKMGGAEDGAYKFPLYIAGGNHALINDIYVYTPIRRGKPTYTDGNTYDLSLKSIAMTSCGILRPCKFNGADSSNFRVLTPEGIWRNIFGSTQNARVQRYFSCGVIHNWMSILEKPSFVSSASYHTALPFMTDSSDAVEFINTPKYSKNISSSFLGRVVISLNMDIDHKEDGILGYIPNLYYICRRNTPIGELMIDGRRFLSIPNNFKDKREYYPVEVGVINTGWTPEELLQKYDIENIESRIYDRILIPIEAGDAS